MMLKKYFLFMMFIFQTACTSVIWNGGIYDADRAINTQMVIQSTAHDQIVAFGRIPEQSNNPLSGSLVMMGENYWYAVQPHISTQITAPLSANLTKRYQISTPYRNEILTHLPVTLIDGQHFESDFCLDYVLENESERAVLQQLRFQLQANPNHYRQCFATTGTIYHKPQQFTPDYHFQKNIPVQITLKQNQTKIQTDKLARNILLTPLALAVDTISGIIMLPALMLGDLF